MSEPLHFLLVGRFSHFEHQRRFSEPQVLGGNVPVQEDVDTWRGHVLRVHERVHVHVCVTLSHAEGHGDDPVGAGDPVQAADEVGQIIQHAQVVFHHDDVPAGTVRSQGLI